MTPTPTNALPTRPSPGPKASQPADDRGEVSAPVLVREPPARSRRRATSAAAIPLRIALPWIAPTVLITLWQLAASRGWIDTKFFPAPSSVWSAGVRMIEDGDLQSNLWVSTKRILQGFGLGVAVGFGLGLVLGVNQAIRSLLEPLLNALYTVPKLALLPLFLLIFGVGETPKILVMSITVFFFMWISTMEAVMSVPTGYEDALRTLGANRRQMYWHVLMPAILPQVFTGMRVSAGVSILTMVGVEFVQASDGIGYLIWHSWAVFLADEMYVGIVVVAVMGVVFTALIRLVARLVIRWQPSSSSRSDPVVEGTT